VRRTWAELFRSGNRTISIGILYSASRLVSAVGLYAGCAALLDVVVRVLGPGINQRLGTF
jgi:hypothetical protein